MAKSPGWRKAVQTCAGNQILVVTCRYSSQLHGQRGLPDARLAKDSDGGAMRPQRAEPSFQLGGSSNEAIQLVDLTGWRKVRENVDARIAGAAPSSSGVCRLDRRRRG